MGVVLYEFDFKAMRRTVGIESWHEIRFRPNSNGDIPLPLMGWNFKTASDITIEINEPLSNSGKNHCMLVSLFSGY